jgi:hypothetical protein
VFRVQAAGFFHISRVYQGRGKKTFPFAYAAMSLVAVLMLRLKVKGHLWVLQHLCLEGVLYSYPNEFLHSSPEALHTPSGVRDLC